MRLPLAALGPVSALSMANLWIYLISTSATSAVPAGAPPVSLSIVLGAACCSAGLLAGVVGLGIWLTLRGRQRDDKPNEKENSGVS
jgi:hypothetical protein